jgi:rsbT co-antagonist protein RsbR
MQNLDASQLAEVIANHEKSIVGEWIEEMTVSTRRSDLMKDSEMRSQCSDFLKLLRRAAESGNFDLNSSAWQGVRELLEKISRTRAQQGFRSTETATFIFSVKKPLFSALRNRLVGDAARLASELWVATELIDSLGLYTAEAFLKAKTDIIRRQQEEMLELSTPVVKLWQGILALPIIGTLDSERTQVVMETLLGEILRGHPNPAI